MDTVKSTVNFPRDMHTRIIEEGAKSMTGKTLQDQVLRLCTEALAARAAKSAREARRAAG